MADEWGPWIEHDGSDCPCPGRLVHVVLGEAVEIGPEGVTFVDLRDERGAWHSCVIDVLADDEAICIAEPSGSWSWSNDCYPIIRYRVRRSATLCQLVDLVERLPDPQPVKAA